MQANICLVSMLCAPRKPQDAVLLSVVYRADWMKLYAAEVVQKEGTKLASRHEFAKRVAMDLYRYEPCSLQCVTWPVNM